MDACEYIPKIIDDRHALFMVALSVCPKCGHKMVAPPDRYQAQWTDTFPKFNRERFDEQAKRAGLRIKSGVQVDGYHICTVCAEEGKADFLCKLCSQRKPTDKIEKSFGDPSEYLCSDCFKTVTAKEWAKAVKELEDAHRYDFE